MCGATIRTRDVDCPSAFRKPKLRARFQGRRGSNATDPRIYEDPIPGPSQVSDKHGNRVDLASGSQRHGPEVFSRVLDFRLRNHAEIHWPRRLIGPEGLLRGPLDLVDFRSRDLRRSLFIGPAVVYSGSPGKYGRDCLTARERLLKIENAGGQGTDSSECSPCVGSVRVVTATWRPQNPGHSPAGRKSRATLDLPAGKRPRPPCSRSPSPPSCRERPLDEQRETYRVESSKQGSAGR